MKSEMANLVPGSLATLEVERRAQQSAHDRQSDRQRILERKIRHKPLSIGTLGTITFSRCKCGFTLARFKGHLWWIRVEGPNDDEPAICDVSEPEELAFALRTDCYWRAAKGGKGSLTRREKKSHLNSQLAK